MAAHARRVRDRVVVVDVATFAIDGRVRAGQSPAHGGMAEVDVIPLHYVVAQGAGSGSTRLHVIRSCRRHVIFLMAPEAVRRSSHKLVIDVALRTSDGSVRAL